MFRACPVVSGFFQTIQYHNRRVRRSARSGRDREISTNRIRVAIASGRAVKLLDDRKKCLAIVYAVRLFRILPIWAPVHPHHRSPSADLDEFREVSDIARRRRRLKLSDYDYQIVYKARKANTNADALSRNPIPALPISSGSTADALYTSDPIPSSSRAPSRKTPTQSSEQPLPPATLDLQPPPDKDDSCDEASITYETSGMEAYDTRRAIVYIRDRLVNQKPR